MPVSGSTRALTRGASLVATQKLRCGYASGIIDVYTDVGFNWVADPDSIPTEIGIYMETKSIGRIRLIILGRVSRRTKGVPLGFVTEGASPPFDRWFFF